MDGEVALSLAPHWYQHMVMISGSQQNSPMHIQSHFNGLFNRFRPGGEPKTIIGVSVTKFFTGHSNEVLMAILQKSVCFSCFPRVLNILLKTTTLNWRQTCVFSWTVIPSNCEERLTTMNARVSINKSVPSEYLIHIFATSKCVTTVKISKVHSTKGLNVDHLLEWKNRNDTIVYYRS